MTSQETVASNGDQDTQGTHWHHVQGKLCRCLRRISQGRPPSVLPTAPPRPARAYSETSTALPHTGHPHVAVSTVWADAGRRPLQLPTQRWTSSMLTTRALPRSASHVPCNAESPPLFRRQGGTPFRRQCVGAVDQRGWLGIHRDTAKKYMEAASPPINRDRVYRSHLISSRAIRVTLMLAT